MIVMIFISVTSCKKELEPPKTWDTETFALTIDWKTVTNTASDFYNYKYVFYKYYQFPYLGDDKGSYTADENDLYSVAIKLDGEWVALPLSDMIYSVGNGGVWIYSQNTPSASVNFKFHVTKSY